MIKTWLARWREIRLQKLQARRAQTLRRNLLMLACHSSEEQKYGWAD